MVFGMGFRTRNPDRDRDTDRERFGRMLSAIESTRAAIAAEREGLQRRYKAVSNDAGFLDNAIDNGETSPENAAKIDQMATTMINYERRVADLSRQIETLDALIRHTTDVTGSHVSKKTTK